MELEAVYAETGRTGGEKEGLGGAGDGDAKGAGAGIDGVGRTGAGI